MEHVKIALSDAQAFDSLVHHPQALPEAGDLTFAARAPSTDPL